MSLLLGRGGGEEGAYARGGAYLRGTTVIPVSMSTTTYYATSVEDVCHCTTVANGIGKYCLVISTKTLT